MRANRGYPDDSLASPISDSTSQKQPMINSVKPPVRFSPKQASFDTPLQGWGDPGVDFFQPPSPGRSPVAEASR